MVSDSGITPATADARGIERRPAQHVRALPRELFVFYSRGAGNYR